ncbi:MAG: hypothetical protein GF329_21195 [Candidatus Lokiarchaeota archaeon]|nr:hypothetical protein [Candidatus Lokiarchaeota archaeon]
MQSEKLLFKFYNNYLDVIRKNGDKAVPASFNEWLKFDFKSRSGVYAIVCPYCSSESIKKGVKVDTRGTSLRFNKYIEYECKDCGGHFLI